MSNEEKTSTEKVTIRPYVTLSQEDYDRLKKDMVDEFRKNEGDLIGAIIRRYYALKRPE